MSNREVARLLAELASLTELEDGSPNSFRARAYQNAVRAVEGLNSPVSEMSEKELTGVRGIGTSTARKIREHVETGTIAKLEKLRERFPPGYVELRRVPGLGPKKLALLREELGIQTLAELQAAIAEERLREIPGLGARTEANLAAAIERLDRAGAEQRVPILKALPVAEEVVEYLREVPGVRRVEYCGSLRRFAETIGDLDVLVAADDPGPVADSFVGLPMVNREMATGGTKTSVVTHAGLQIDLRVVTPDQYGSALIYFTGSKAHNIALRQRALERGWTLSEYALAEIDSKRVVASRTEEEVYEALGLSYIEPPLREDVGEIEAAARGELPDLVHLEHLRGDLHDHTTLSGDGRSTLEDLVEAAVERRLQYLAITDHAEDLSVSGVSREAMLAQRERIAELGRRYPRISLLHGAELNIGRDGGLDYDAGFLAGYDFCVASVHSHFRLDASEQTRRVIEAMRHPAVNVIGHLTGRRIGKRPGIDLDVGAVFEAAQATGTALEINSNLDRLDVPAGLLRQARGTDVLFAISTDAHSVRELDFHRYGVRNAQRGWVDRAQVVNTWETSRFLDWLNAKRSR